MSLFVYRSRKEKQHCSSCAISIARDQFFVAPSEEERGTCFSCSPFSTTEFLPSGNVALTRRSKKYSSVCGVVLVWNNKRRRYERQGQFVDSQAILQAQKECDADSEIRKQKNEKAAIKREEVDKEYLQAFAQAIRLRYPQAPAGREIEIARHACEKYSGRVGRSAQAKQFDPQMIDLAVEAHIRHRETNYDQQFGKGIKKREIRTNLKPVIVAKMKAWRS